MGNMSIIWDKWQTDGYTVWTHRQYKVILRCRQSAGFPPCFVQIWWYDGAEIHRLDGPAFYSFRADDEDLSKLCSLADPAGIDSVGWTQPRHLYWFIHAVKITYEFGLELPYRHPVVSQMEITGLIRRLISAKNQDSKELYLRILKILRPSLADTFNLALELV